MTQKFRILQEMVEALERTKKMDWLEESFRKVGEKGGECRALLAVATLGVGCTNEEIAKCLNVAPHTAYCYLKKLIDKGVLERRGHVYYSVSNGYASIPKKDEEVG